MAARATTSAPHPPVPARGDRRRVLAGRRRRRRHVADVRHPPGDPAEQATPHEPRRIVREGRAAWLHQVRFGDDVARRLRVHARGDAADRSRGRELVHERASRSRISKTAWSSRARCPAGAARPCSTVSSVSGSVTARATAGLSRRPRNCGSSSRRTSAWRSIPAAHSRAPASTGQRCSVRLQADEVRPAEAGRYVVGCGRIGLRCPCRLRVAESWWRC